MENVLQSILNTVNKNDNIVVGISGGADSMVLLDLLLKVKQLKEFNLLVIHIEHQIRGDESKSDAKFVEDFCKRKGIDYKIISENIPKLAKENKQTVEECAREFRYQQFYKYMDGHGKLFIAHNKNDQAETVLMHIFRGSGINGAAGIRQTDKIFRPLLSKTKAEIIDYAKSNNIAYVTDSTNNDSQYCRNYIRNIVLPKIEEVYPSTVDAVAKFAGYALECEKLIDSLINPKWINAKQNSVDIAAFDVSPLVTKKVIELAYNNCKEYSDLESKHITMVTELASNCKNGSTCNLPHGVIAEKRQNSVYFYKLDNKNEMSFAFGYGVNNLPNNKTAIVTKVSEDDVEFGDGNYYIDYLKVPLDAVWRTRRDGDYFARIGSGKKKLNDYFTDKKLPKNVRDNTVVLASKNTVLLVLGQDISENIKLDANTQEIAKIQFKGNN